MKCYLSLILFFFAAVSVAKEPVTSKKLSNDDLDGINQKLIALDGFKDNTFIYEEKVAELHRGIKKFEGAKVRLFFTVSMVHPTRVYAYPTLPRDAPGLRCDINFVNTDKVQQPLIQGFVIGEAVDLELAKVLRRFDIIVVEGELKSIQKDTPSSPKGIIKGAKLTFVVACTEVTLLPYAKAFELHGAAQIQELDRNNDSVLDEGEWSQLRGAAAADTNGDGKLTAEEWGRFKFKRN